MKPFITISTVHGPLYFSLFYLMAVMTCIVFALIEGYRRKYPMVQWLLIISSGVTFLIVGTKIFSYSFNDLHRFLTDFYLPNNGRKTILGGIVGLFFGIGIARLVLKFKYPILDTIAIALPISMAIQKMGCLMTGCCYGKPCQLPWAITYSEHGIPYHSQLVNGLIEPGRIISHAVHPTQVYAIIAYLLIALIVLKTKNKFQVSGNRLFFAIALFAGYRFFEEFLRDPNAGFFAPKFYFGISLLQWIIAGITIGLFLIIFTRERYSKYPTCHENKIKSKVLSTAAFYIILLFTVRFIIHWLTAFEILMILLIFIPTTIAVCWAIYEKLTVPGYRYMTISILFLGMILMSQTMPDKLDITNDDQKMTFSTLSAGAVTGVFSNITTMRIGDGCTGYHEIDFLYKHNYTGGGLGFTQTWKNGEYFYHKFNFNSNFVRDNFKLQDSDQKNSNIYIELNPGYEINWKMIGIGFGLHLGDFRYNNRVVDKYDFNSSDVDEGGIKQYFIYPQVLLRIGPKEYFYIEDKLTNCFPASSPMPFNQIGIGSGLGKLEKHSIGIGLADHCMYVSGTIAVNRHWLLEAFYMDNFNSGFDAKKGIAISTHYRFGFESRE